MYNPALSRKSTFSYKWLELLGASGGLIQYDFTRNTKWQNVGDLMVSVVVVAGVTIRF